MHGRKLTSVVFHTIGNLFSLKMRNCYCLYQTNKMFSILSHLKSLSLLFQEFCVSMRYSIPTLNIQATLAFSIPKQGK